MRSREARARPVYRQAVMRADSAGEVPDPTVLLEAAATVELCGAKGKPGSPRGASCAGSPDGGGESGGDNGSANGGGSVPGLKRQLQWHHLVGVTFFAVCGGDYGIEDSVGSGGVAYSLLGLLLLPWFWSLPIALMTAELGAMIPEAGGYVVWVHRAFGPFWATQNAVWNLVSNTFDNALYPVMFVDYLQWFPLFETGFATYPILRWLVSVAMLAVVTGLNLLGVDVVAQVSNLFAAFVISPFVALSVAGVMSGRGLQTAVWTSDLFREPNPPMRWGTFLSVLLWNTSGYDSVGALAAEVEQPGRDFPRALGTTIVLVTVTYLVPLAVATSLDAEHVRAWSDGSFVRVAAEHVGGWLAAWVTIGGALSCFGLLNTLLCTSARVAVSAAKLRVLPASVAKVHAESGVPRVATVLLSTVLAIACTLPFSQLVSISMLFYGATTLIEVLALLALRVWEPLMPRPFRIPLRASPLALFYVGPMLLSVVLALLAPPEAWLLFLVSSAAACVAHARSSGATLSSAARACAGGPGWWWRWRPAARYLLPADAAAKAGVQLEVFDQASQRGEDGQRFG